MYSSESTARKVGGGACTDGVTLFAGGRHFYDLTLHLLVFFIYPNRTDQLNVKIISKTKLLRESSAHRTASGIRLLLNSRMQDRYRISFDDTMGEITLVTDHCAVMPCIVGASVRYSRSPCNHRCVLCVVHAINNAMKTALDTLRASSPIPADLKRLMEIVSVFKKSGQKYQLPHRSRLIQEVGKVFETTFNLCKRFTDSFPLLVEIVHKCDNENVKSALNSLTMADMDGNRQPSEISDLVSTFEKTFAFQKYMEGSRYPAMHLIVPCRHDCLLELENNASSVPRNETLMVLCQSSSRSFHRKLVIHDMCLAGTYLNPPLRDFSLVEDTLSVEYIRRADNFIRKTMSECNPASASHPAHTLSHEVSRSGHGDYAVPDEERPKKVRKKFDRDSLAMYFPRRVVPAEADAVKNLTMFEVQEVIDDVASFLLDPFEVPQFW